MSVSCSLLPRRMVTSSSRPLNKLPDSWKGVQPVYLSCISTAGQFSPVNISHDEALGLGSGAPSVWLIFLSPYLSLLQSTVPTSIMETLLKLSEIIHSLSLWQVQEPTLLSPSEKLRFKKINIIRSRSSAYTPPVVTCCAASKSDHRSPPSGPASPNNPVVAVPHWPACCSSDTAGPPSLLLPQPGTFSCCPAKDWLLVTWASPQMPPSPTFSLTKSTLLLDVLGMNSNTITFQCSVYILFVLPMSCVAPTGAFVSQSAAAECQEEPRHAVGLSKHWVSG